MEKKIRKAIFEYTSNIKKENLVGIAKAFEAGAEFIIKGITNGSIPISIEGYYLLNKEEEEKLNTKILNECLALFYTTDLNGSCITKEFMIENNYFGCLTERYIAQLEKINYFEMCNKK